MPLTRETMPALGQALMILWLVVCKLVLSFFADLRGYAELAIDEIDDRLAPVKIAIAPAVYFAEELLARAVDIVAQIPRPTRAEVVTFALMFSLGVNLVTVLAVMEYAT